MKEKEILANIASRLAIGELNDMQRRMAGLQTKGTVTLIAPTGSARLWHSPSLYSKVSETPTAKCGLSS